MLKKFLCSILSLMILVSTPVVVMADTKLKVFQDLVNRQNQKPIRIIALY